jgi:hypothetical protein
MRKQWNISTAIPQSRKDFFIIVDVITSTFLLNWISPPKVRVTTYQHSPLRKTEAFVLLNTCNICCYGSPGVKASAPSKRIQLALVQLKLLHVSSCCLFRPHLNCMCPERVLCGTCRCRSNLRSAREQIFHDTKATKGTQNAAMQRGSNRSARVFLVSLFHPSISYLLTTDAALKEAERQSRNPEMQICLSIVTSFNIIGPTHTTEIMYHQR